MVREDYDADGGRTEEVDTKVHNSMITEVVKEERRRINRMFIYLKNKFNIQTKGEEK